MHSKRSLVVLAGLLCACPHDDDQPAADDSSSSSGGVDTTLSPTTAPETSNPTTTSATTAEPTDDTSSEEDSADASTEASSESGSTGDATIEVSGTVTGFIGRPLAGVDVTIGDTTVTTDDEGAFTIAGVTAPYDARVVAADSGATIFLGLTRADPSLHLCSADGEYHTAEIEGLMSGGAGFPNPSQHVFAVAFDGFDTHDESWSYSIGNGPSYHLQPQWYGAAAQEGTVLAVQYHQVDNGHPLDYDGIGVLDVVISDGGVFADQDLVLAPVGDAVVAGMLGVPAEAEYSQVRMFIGVGEEASVLVGYEDDPGDTYSFAAPDGADAWMSTTLIAGVGSSGVFAFRTGIAADTLDADLDIPVLPTWDAPANGGMIAQDSMLQWSGIADAVSVVLLTCEDADLGVRIVTADSSTPVPDLADLGTLIPAGANCYVVLDQYAPFTDVDAFSAPESPMRNRSRVDASYPATALFDGAFATIPDIVLHAE
ncbi:MAG TPA: hypothetical protein VG755_41030 [Nannocystaceae bacterium]|nr:hypothetical protein [Nannocystaceae bacterium]